jgi:hypothetical protein
MLDPSGSLTTGFKVTRILASQSLTPPARSGG